jgi:aminoglycoside phosphotransferase family enzyme/predicted kinase
LKIPLLECGVVSKYTKGQGSSESDPDHAAVMDWLSEPSTYGGQPVERVDTHISHLFLSGSEVFKLKRPIRTNFLDFSTIELREKACRREIEVNRAVAKYIYLGVVPIVCRGGELNFGGPGKTLDWVVRMRRFNRANELDRLAERGELDITLVEALADTVASMHQSATITKEFGGAARVRATIAQIAEAIMASPSAAGMNETVAEWVALAEQSLSSCGVKLDARRRHGYVRRCHGDLHLGNICLIKGRPTPFDALEFNEEMASTDIFYDISFVVMDLLERALGAQANAFLSRYLAVTRDYSGLDLLSLFISMRAAVRALVAVSQDTSNSHEPSAKERLLFALEMLQRPKEPQLVAIGGLSGSGKSTVARLVAPQIGGGTGAIVLRSDVARKHMLGVPPEDRLPPAAYRPGTSARVYTRLLRGAGRVLGCDYPVLVDATFLSRSEREQFRVQAIRSGVDFCGIWLDCDPGLLRSRVRNRKGDASDAGIAVLEKQLTSNVAPGDWIRIRSAGSAEDTASRVMSAINSFQGLVR